MGSVHVADDRHTHVGRRLSAGIELLGLVLGVFSVMVFSLQLQAIIVIDLDGTDWLDISWLAILFAGVLLGVLSALSLLWRPLTHSIGAVALIMVVAEVLANLIIADFDFGTIFTGYPEALGGQFGTESLIAAWRFPLTAFIAVLYLVWLKDRPRARLGRPEGR